jgi:hypothetical protein
MFSAIAIDVTTLTVVSTREVSLAYNVAACLRDVEAKVSSSARKVYLRLEEIDDLSKNSERFAGFRGETIIDLGTNTELSWKLSTYAERHEFLHLLLNGSMCSEFQYRSWTLLQEESAA